MIYIGSKVTVAKIMTNRLTVMFILLKSILLPNPFPINATFFSRMTIPKLRNKFFLQIYILNLMWFDDRVMVLRFWKDLDRANRTRTQVVCVACKTFHVFCFLSFSIYALCLQLKKLENRINTRAYRAVPSHYRSDPSPLQVS